jgi:hypothetical protein
VVRFLESVKAGDATTFWNVLDKRGQGYFMGLWFYAMESMNIETIIRLTGEKEFLDGVLGPIIAALRDTIGDLLDDPCFGEIKHHTPYYASIKVTPGQQKSPSADEEDDYIPLVLELGDDQNLDVNLTCWKIDTLNCFQLNKSIN